MNRVYKKIEVVGTSDESVSDAIRIAVERAAETVSNITWYEVDEIRGAVKDDKTLQHQVTLKIGFRVGD